MLNDNYCQDFYSSGLISLNPPDPEGTTLITLRGWNELVTSEKRTRGMLQLILYVKWLMNTIESRVV